MRIVKLTDETKNNILENLLKRSPNSYGKISRQKAMRLYLNILRILIRLISMLLILL